MQEKCDEGNFGLFEEPSKNFDYFVCFTKPVSFGCIVIEPTRWDTDMDLTEGKGASFVPKKVDLLRAPKEVGATNLTLTTVESKKSKIIKVEPA